MKLSEAVDTICFTPASDGPEVRGSSRYTPRVLSSLQPQTVSPSDHLDGSETVPGCSTNWTRNVATKIWGVARLLRVLAMPWKAECCSDAAAVPRYTQTFVPYIYSRRELRLLLDACATLSATCGVP